MIIIVVAAAIIPKYFFVRPFPPLAPSRTQLAKKLHNQVKVGKLDGTKEVSIARRFGVRVYPSLFLLANGTTWQYQGERFLDNLEMFATSGYKKATPFEFWRAPNSSFGRFVGFLWRIPTIAETTYWYLTEEQGKGCRCYDRLPPLSCL